MPFMVLSGPPQIGNHFVKAPYGYHVLKEPKSFKKRFRDIKTPGRFLVYKIELTNKDSIDHLVDYSCFCLTSGDGAEYNVHPEATVIKQTELEDIQVKDIDTHGFYNQTTKSNFKTQGWLIFEVPDVGEYRLVFQGYLK